MATEGSADEIKWLIEDRRRRMEDVQEQLAAVPDDDVAAGLKGILRLLEEEIADLESELCQRDENDDEIADLDTKIRDIDLMLESETDPIVRNNLEVSKRYLQMERNGALIRQTQSQKRKDPQEERIAELKKLNDDRLRLIQDLQGRLARAEKDLSYYKALAEHPERNVSCGTSRVTVTADSLSALRNESKVLSVENYKLKEQVRDLKNELEMQRKNIRELTLHCKDADSQILILQARVQELMKKLDSE